MYMDMSYWTALCIECVYISILKMYTHIYIYVCIGYPGHVPTFWVFEGVIRSQDANVREVWVLFTLVTELARMTQPN